MFGGSTARLRLAWQSDRDLLCLVDSFACPIVTVEQFFEIP